MSISELKLAKELIRKPSITPKDAGAIKLLAKNLKGKLLLAHGNLDDNVPPYSTLLVVDALIKENKDFDLIIFPNKRSSILSKN